MGRYAYLFPGQGSQYVGMGKDFYDTYPIAKDIFTEANDALGCDLAAICFQGPEEELNLTFNTQPALLTVSYIAYKILESEGMEPYVTAGHSLGEYSALAAGGAISFTDAVSAVRKRGQFMQEAVPVGKGAMAAVLGMDKEQVEKVCSEVSSRGVVGPANYNCPGQLVISGEKSAVEYAVEQVRLKGAKKAVMLPVSAPFHSSLMKPVEEKLRIELQKINFRDPAFSVIANANTQEIARGDEIVSSLIRQVSAPVLWEQSIEKMLGMGVDGFVEVGPGKILSAMLKRISRGTKGHNVEDGKSLEKTLTQIEGIGS